MRKQILLTGAAALVAGAFSGPALAADPMPIVVAAPVTVAAYVAAPRTWTGGYVGGHAALVRGNATDGFTCDDGDEELTFFFITTIIGQVPSVGGSCEDTFTDPAVVLAGSLDPDSFLNIEIFENDFGMSPINGYEIGGQIGYNRQLGNGGNGFVIGGEVAVGLTSAQGVVFGELDDGQIEVLGFFSMDAVATATLRAGFAFGPALIYAEGGLALGHFTYNDNMGFDGQTMAHGLVYGGGIEGKISQNVSLFFEYNRLRFNQVTMQGQDLFVFNTIINANVTANVFKAGFNIHFGGDN